VVGGLKADRGLCNCESCLKKFGPCRFVQTQTTETRGIIKF